MKVSIFSLFMLVLMTQGQAFMDCGPKFCGKIEIKFPFLLQSDPQHCGYPGFNLYCTDRKETVLNLPNSVTLYIQKIDYASQVIYTSSQPHCDSVRGLSFELSASPFRFQLSEDYRSGNYSFFNCSGRESRTYPRVDCLNNAPDYVVYAVPSYYSIGYSHLTNCTKMYSIPDLPGGMFVDSEDVQLNWTRPSCGFCERRHQGCKLKDGSKSETECVDKRKDIWKKVMIGIGSFTLLILVVSLYLVYRADQKEKKQQARVETFLDDYKTFKPTRYLYSDLRRITNRFKHELGQGAHGTVFKGSLSSEIHVAVKMLNNSTATGDDFINEVGTMGRIHHVNIVRLVGFCADGFRRALVYEFLPNETLERFILSDEEVSPSDPLSLGWEQIQEIALGIANGVEYLHQGCDHRILHFDIKPHNILLDKYLTPKVSDFGLAKLCSKDKSSISMTAERGTVGYIAPEVFSRNFGNVSYKSDVYSFGMLLLELVGGRRRNTDRNKDIPNPNPAGKQQNYFPEWIYEHLEDESKELNIRIKRDGDVRIARKLMVVGLWCIQWYPVDRPSMKMVVQMLQGEVDQELRMPPNPFTSSGAKKIDGVVAGRKLYQELEVISEIE